MKRKLINAKHRNSDYRVPFWLGPNGYSHQGGPSGVNALLFFKVVFLKQDSAETQNSNT